MAWAYGTTNTVVLVDYCVCTRITHFFFIFVLRFTVGLFFTCFNFYNFYFLQPLCLGSPFLKFSADTLIKIYSNVEVPLKLLG